MTISDYGKEMIQEHEGLRLQAYICPTGHLTIGWGHTGPDVTPGLVITRERAEQLLAEDIAKAGRGVARCIQAPLTQNQYDALVSFTFNLGEGRLAGSTLRRLINNNPSDETIGPEFNKWIYGVNPKTGIKEKVPGLIRRRDDEARHYYKQ